MRQLLLLRHAQAEPARPGVTDVDRPLSAVGHNEALDVAQCIADMRLHIDALLVSPAVRARDTATIVAAHLDIVDGVRYEPGLYLGDCDALLSPLQRCGAADQTVVLIGHNPGISELACRLVGDDSIALRTSGLCRIEFDDQSWRGIGSESIKVFEMLR